MCKHVMSSFYQKSAVDSWEKQDFSIRNFPQQKKKSLPAGIPTKKDICAKIVQFA